jgi:hypothetical protein
MGHGSALAAMIYLHGSPGADRIIADGLPVEFEADQDGNDWAGPWHVHGTRTPSGGERKRADQDRYAADLRRKGRAGDRDRTGMASLEGWGSAIELHPRVAGPA